MLDTLFGTIFDSSGEITVLQFLLCILVSLVLGAALALAYMYKSKYTKTFVLTLALLPAVVCVVILMVNGNIGAGIAVAGAFSLVRFRSVPGTAKEIAAIFISMVAGLVMGTGYIGYAVLFTVVLGAAMMIYSATAGKKGRRGSPDRTLRITIPENLNYTDTFDSVLETYTTSYEIVSVKTTNMGSLYRLTYDLTMKDPSKEKEFIDELRCLNGNLEICICRQEMTANEL